MTFGILPSARPVKVMFLEGCGAVCEIPEAPACLLRACVGVLVGFLSLLVLTGSGLDENLLLFEDVWGATLSGGFLLSSLAAGLAFVGGFGGLLVAGTPLGFNSSGLLVEDEDVPVSLLLQAAGVLLSRTALTLDLMPFCTVGGKEAADLWETERGSTAVDRIAVLGAFA